jgi:hypothetical protein
MFVVQPAQEQHAECAGENHGQFRAPAGEPVADGHERGRCGSKPGLLHHRQQQHPARRRQDQPRQHRQAARQGDGVSMDFAMARIVHQPRAKTPPAPQGQSRQRREAGAHDREQVQVERKTHFPHVISAPRPVNEIQFEEIRFALPGGRRLITRVLRQPSHKILALSLLAAVFLWGANNAGTKHLVETWPPAWTGGSRFFLAGLLLLAVLRHTTWLGKASSPRPGLELQLWLRGGLSLAIYIVVFNSALRYTAASHVALYLGASRSGPCCGRGIPRPRGTVSVATWRRVWRWPGWRFYSGLP